ncbi:hypothetical protein CEXT_202981 [Caerostris extrusa]|uniref:Uncharacterized protein n=1 Tax=Caerostris extrusa TaxID=172846 RepID=A0AAV4PV24_CAEEX|nr:hypothetical protein CEXT_202981 [Caerostris extrusa]
MATADQNCARYLGSVARFSSSTASGGDLPAAWVPALGILATRERDDIHIVAPPWDGVAMGACVAEGKVPGGELSGRRH